MKGLREIPWGVCGMDYDQICIYDNGHVDPALFLNRVREMKGSDVPEDARAALTVADVDHVRFRPMSPTEASNAGVKSGITEAEEGRGYAVTRVIL